MPKARILAVDDQRYFRELVEGLLSEAGFEAQTASSAEEALRILEQSHFDIVVTDLVMPGMDGSELVHRIKQRSPDQDIVVVTGVVDVKTAVEAMKLGATDYLLKPFDRATLEGCLEGILNRRRLRAEHERLLAENIEYMGERSLYERALRLFSRLSVPALADDIIEGLCVETQAQRGVFWAASLDSPERLELAAARGLVRVEEEAEALELGSLPEPLRAGDPRARVSPEEEGAELVVALRLEGHTAGFACLGDKLGGEPFDPVDAGCAERFAGFAEAALANAMRFRTLERRTLRDAGSGAYIFPYFEDVTRNEIEKANRFGRCFSLLALDLGPLHDLRRDRGEAWVDGWLAELASSLRQLLRATDLLALDGHQRFWTLLPEADALGASVLKQRAREMVARTELAGVPGLAPEVAVATYPGDGTQLEVLVRTLENRLEEARRNHSKIQELTGLSLAESLRSLVEREGREAPAEAAPQLTRFVLDEVARRPAERRLLFVAPGDRLADALAEGLGGLRGLSRRTEIAVLADGERPAFADADVAWIPSERAPGMTPFLVHYGDGPPFALVQEDGPAGRGRLFQTSDRSLVEHLTLRLQRELGVGARGAEGVERVRP